MDQILNNHFEKRNGTKKLTLPYGLSINLRDLHRIIGHFGATVTWNRAPVQQLTEQPCCGHVIASRTQGPAFEHGRNLTQSLQSSIRTWWSSMPLVWCHWRGSLKPCDWSKEQKKYYNFLFCIKTKQYLLRSKQVHWYTQMSFVRYNCLNEYLCTLWMSKRRLLYVMDV